MATFSLLVVAVLLVCSTALPVPLQSSPVTVQTTNGPIIGSHLKTKGTTVFKGVPFGAPPVGDLRFAAPQPPKAWTKPLTTQSAGNLCPQMHAAGPIVLGHEDCLYLNVFVPDQRTDTANTTLPVLFWIFGGGFVFGDGNEFGMYDGTALANERNVIVVTANYRVDVFGFIALNELKSEDANGSTGNVGLLDQRLALQWVQDNIHAFGGDPSRVTIFGESAGGFSVCWHLAAPGSAGLFSRAIMESGSCDVPFFFRPLADAVEFSEKIATAVGCPLKASRLSCLRKKDYKNLITSVTTWILPSWPNPIGKRPDGLPALAPYMPWATVIDGSPAGLSDVPIKLMARGEFNKVPTIMGTNKDEGTVFIPFMDFIPGVWAPFNDHMLMLAFTHIFNETTAEQILSFYKNDDYLEDVSDLVLAAAIIRDYVFTCSNRRAARVASPHTPIWVYEFDYDIRSVIGQVMGEAHASEIRYVFDNQWPPVFGRFSEKDQLMANEFGEYWGNMAYFANPNGAADAPTHTFTVNWPAFADGKAGGAEQTISLDVPAHVDKATHAHVCDFWDTVRVDSY